MPASATWKASFASFSFRDTLTSLSPAFRPFADLPADQYAVSTTLSEEMRETRLSSRGLAYGIPALRVDGMDPLAVRLAAQTARDAGTIGEQH